MFSQLVKQDIKSFATKLYSENQFFLAAQNCTLDKGQIAIYLRNLHFLFTKTTQNLKLAQAIAQDQNDPALAQFYKDKYQEEFGHDQWPLADLKHFGVEGDINTVALLQSVTELAKSIEIAIIQNPKDYLSYMFLTEYITVLIAPAFLKCLETNLGISRTQMTAISNHEELDKAHAHEDLDIIDRFIGDGDRAKFMVALNLFKTKVEDFFSELSECTPC